MIFTLFHTFDLPTNLNMFGGGSTARWRRFLVLTIAKCRRTATHACERFDNLGLEPEAVTWRRSTTKTVLLGILRKVLDRFDGRELVLIIKELRSGTEAS
ncbi:hypothetical protein CA13_28480 [Planctomycetes bacterium CA13]|uniref:Uncharacterized protein n=1 Tax=Novipirellula herctigrandis TaxID=2527986 RepID=A0A5C5Z2H1_9BACT|nr:hypothetical protein CA13_28480 [Planctomycetes bacterium CA13]